MASRNTLGGAATPVTLIGTESTDGTITQGTINTEVDELEFTPVGAHSDGLAISTAQSLISAVGSTKLLIQALTQNVRFTLDGSIPTASRGFQLKAGDPPTIIPMSGSTTVKVIEETATADLQFQWGS